MFFDLSAIIIARKNQFHNGRRAYERISTIEFCCALHAVFFTTTPAFGEPHMINVSQLNAQAQKVLNYDLGIELINAPAASSEITITCHGYGANKDIGYMVAERLDTPILTFNFPDHDIDNQFDIHTSSFGTIREYLPLVFVLKACAENGISTIHLYGYSAGGGAIINALAILNNPKHKEPLAAMGISDRDRIAIAQAVSNGLIILDAPLKSVTEILSIRPSEEDIQILAVRFSANGFEAIDAIDELAGLKLNVIVYFEIPDEILSNRDDELYFQKLKAVNKAGITQLVFGYDDGHFGPHEPLWAAVRVAKNIKSR